jgi:hypothetical protein
MNTNIDHTQHPAYALAVAPRRMAIIFEPTSEHGLLDYNEVNLITDQRQREALTALLDSFYCNPLQENSGFEGISTYVITLDLAGTGAEKLDMPVACDLSRTASIGVAALINYDLNLRGKEEASHAADG